MQTDGINDPAIEAIKSLINAASVEFSRKPNGRDSDYVSNAPADIDYYSEADYNKYGWARVNNVISATENRAFSSRLSDMKNGTKPERTSDGKYIFAVGNKFGVNNVLIISDGKYVSPSIERVYRIDLDNETDIGLVRGIIYEQEHWNSAQSSYYVQQIWGEALINTYERSDMRPYRELQSERPRNERSGSGEDNRNNRFEQDGIRNNGENESSDLDFSRLTFKDDLGLEHTISVPEVKTMCESFFRRRNAYLRRFLHVYHFLYTSAVFCFEYNYAIIISNNKWRCAKQWRKHENNRQHIMVCFRRTDTWN